MSNAIDIARRLDALEQTQDACAAYTLVLHQGEEAAPEEELEAAIYLFQHGEDYKVPYTTFRSLYNRGHFRPELLNIMTDAFYVPNVKLMKSRYEKNCKLLSRYPYLFRKDFVPFDELPVLFFPYDDNGYLPFHILEEHFADYWNPSHPVVSRNFFKDLDNPILAADVFSQYELEYLNDNVRKSEWVGRENHIYLHYTNWAVFCAYLQILNLRPLLEEKKILFLIEEEVSQYPIDFKARFGIDYIQFTPKPIGIKEINRLIWHTQLSSHNGGDFFNEVLYGHPNLICIESVMMSKVESCINSVRDVIIKGNNCTADNTVLLFYPGNRERMELEYVPSLRGKSQTSDKDILAAVFLDYAIADGRKPDPTQRIVPAILFQPHFHNIVYSMAMRKDEVKLLCEEYDKVVTSPVFRSFKYIKTFTPMRRLTTSLAATIKYQVAQIDLETGYAVPDAEHPWVEDERCRHIKLVPDGLNQRILNRSFMIDWQNRLFQDCRLVRFEDGKLNPKATFTALAAFLDIPYTESMTYCSSSRGIDPETMKGNVRGFDPATVYRTYDEYLGTAERILVEYTLRDVYETYGYDFHYYDNTPMPEERIWELLQQTEVLDRYISTPYRTILHQDMLKILHPFTQKEIREIEQKGGEIIITAEQMRIKKALEERPGEWKTICQEMVDEYLARRRAARLTVCQATENKRYLNSKDQPLHMMPMLHLDPQLLEQPLYR